VHIKELKEKLGDTRVSHFRAVQRNGTRSIPTSLHLEGDVNEVGPNKSALDTPVLWVDLVSLDSILMFPRFGGQLVKED
jgi:hypothetical protein